jgi:uncharacterized membrane protein/protein-disulfide isomerase
MPLRLRLVLLRLTAMAGLVVSALLTYDKLHPDRAFCPLAEACKQAGASALGSLFGVPTSLIGLGAFGGLFLLTLLPADVARRPLKLAGVLGALGGAVFFGYQALALDAYCPLCLIADAAGLAAGALTLGWGPGARGRGGSEGGGARVAWLLAAALAVVVPFAWPRTPRPAFVEITPAADLFEDEAPAEPAPAVAAAKPAAKPPTVAVPPATSTQPPSRLPPGSRQGIPARPGEPLPLPPPLPGTTASGAAPAPAPATTAARPPSAVATTSAKPPTPAAGAPTAGAPSSSGPVAANEILVVEYLNAYCPHCRATHARLEQAIAATGLKVRKRRVYTWATTDYPAWARACALAQSFGLEDRMFDELLRSRGPDVGEVKAAAARAGLDVAALDAALKDPNPPPRLVKDRQLFTQARLQGLPTLDIGRRRLMGEQTEAELRAALEAARPPAAPPR